MWTRSWIDFLLRSMLFEVMNLPVFSQPANSRICKTGRYTGTVFGKKTHFVRYSGMGKTV